MSKIKSNKDAINMQSLFNIDPKNGHAKFNLAYKTCVQYQDEAKIIRTIRSEKDTLDKMLNKDGFYLHFCFEVYMKVILLSDILSNQSSQAS